MDDSLKFMVGGNCLLIVCSMFYLAWWIVAFRPGHPAARMLCGTLLALAFLTGFAGIYCAVHGMGALTLTREHISTLTIAIAGILLYLVLLAVTGFLMKRQLTSELFLILGWAVLEISMVNLLYASGRFTSYLAICFCVFIGIVVLINLVCYLAYYKLSGSVSYYDGMIPLIVDAIMMVAITVRML